MSPFRLCHTVVIARATGQHAACAKSRAINQRQTRGAVMKKTLTALAAAALFAAFTAPVVAQQPATPPAQKGQTPSPADTNKNKKSESGAQTTTGAGAATGA